MKDSILYKIVRPFIIFFTKVILRPKFIGIDNIPKNSNYILAGNHTNNLDCVLLITASKKDVHFLAKYELFKGLKGIIFSNLGLIPVDRRNHTTKALDKSLKYLDSNKVIGIFPEGTYPKNGEKLLDFKTGVVKLSHMSNTPIIPFVIKGKYKRKVTIEFLKPRYISDDIDKENKKLEKDIAKKIKESKNNGK